MITFFENLFNPSGNAVEVSKILVQLLKVKVSFTSLEKSITEHPDYPSLLCISDSLSGYGVDNVTVEIPLHKLEHVEVPFICQVIGSAKKITFFTVVREIKNGTIEYWEPEKHKWVRSSLKSFMQISTGIVLMASPNEDAGERDFNENEKSERRKAYQRMLLLLGLPAIVLTAVVWAFVINGVKALLPSLYIIFALCGLFVGCLLLWYEIDKHNPVLKQICTIGRKTGCATILQSKSSKILGISWSAIGTSYFAGQLLMLLFYGIMHPGVLFLVTWINTLAAAYILFSVFYQWRVAKRWCLLCLSVQAVLLLQLVTEILGGWHQIAVIQSVHGSIVLSLLPAFILPFILVNLLVPAYRGEKEKKYIKSELQRLKHNFQVFDTVMSKQRIITEDTAGLGITLGNPDAPYKIIKVCNPYCGPCSKAHPLIDDILNNNPNVQVQIIFTASGEETDNKTAPVRHLMAIASLEDISLTKRALDDWYMAKVKEYDGFALKYPMNGELKQQDKKIISMRAWCDRVEIDYTPTFFVNGRQLPESYNLTDLRYILST